MRSYIANVFGGIDGLIKRNTQRRTSFDIDYDMIQKRDVKESRFVIGKIVMETICCAVDHEVMARREEDHVEKEIVEKQQITSACQSLPAKNMSNDDVFTRVKPELQQKKEKKQLSTKKQKVVKTEDNKYVAAKVNVTGKERCSLSQSKVVNMPKTIENREEQTTHKCNVPVGGVAAQHNKKGESQASKEKGSPGSLSALFKRK